jgi:hypothetical protein
MSSPSQWSARERAARSRLAQLLHQQDFIAGSLVTMRRVCGKPTCHCARGEKHVSDYLALSVNGKRTMMIVPKEQLEAVRNAVQTYKRVLQLQKTLSSECHGRLMREAAKE